MFRIAIQRTLGDLNGEVQDGRTAIVETGPPVIQGDTVGKEGVAQGLQPGSDANSTACLTKQFFGGRVLTGMSSTKRIWGFLVRIILQGPGPLTTPALPLAPIHRSVWKRRSRKFV